MHTCRWERPSAVHKETRPRWTVGMRLHNSATSFSSFSHIVFTVCHLYTSWTLRGMRVGLSELWGKDWPGFIHKTKQEHDFKTKCSTINTSDFKIKWSQIKFPCWHAPLCSRILTLEPSNSPHAETGQSPFRSAVQQTVDLLVLHLYLLHPQFPNDNLL